MATAVIMPKVDMDQETGTLIEWLKHEGESVKQGEALLMMETAKVAIEVESPATGILGGLQLNPGDTVPIGTVIGYVLAEGEALPAPAAAKAAAAPAAAPAATTAPAPPREVTPVARRMAEVTGVDLTAVEGTGPHGKITKNDVQTALVAPQGNSHGDGKINATPAARRTAREEAVDLASVPGSGPQGRVQAADVAGAAAQLAATAMPRAAAQPSGEDQIIPLQGMRRTIAERMTASYQSTPHISFTARVDMTRFNAARAELNAQADKVGAGHISATAMFVKAVAGALARHPWLNSSLRGDQIHLRREINVGVAVALETGLIVPVVRNADRKGIAQIAAEVNDLTERARKDQLTPGDVSGGTFTISNLGPFGIEQFAAIINSPQAAILAVGSTQFEAIPEEDGQIVAKPIMRMTLSADHRIVDGAVAARFVTDLKSTLEAPTLLLW